MPSKKQAKAGVTKQKFDSCISKVKAKGSGNPYAICNASFNKHIAKKRMKK